MTAELAWAALAAELRHTRRRPTTIRSYRWVVRAFWRQLERGGKTWQQPSPDDLEAFCCRPPTGGGKGHELSDHSKAHYSSLVLNAYQLLTDLGLLERNPLARVVRFRDPDPVPRALELAEVARLLDYADVMGDARLGIMLWCGFGAGLRVGELCAARIEDLRLGTHPQLVVRGKGGRSRVVPLPAPLPELLGRWVASPMRVRGRPELAARSRGPLVPRADGSHMTVRFAQQKIARAMAVAGVHGTFHCLRHSYATELLRAGRGANLLAVSKLLGHRSVLTTQRVYVGGYHEDELATAALLPDPRGA